MEGICPNCGCSGQAGTPCGTEGCAVHHLHFVPPELVTAGIAGPLGRDPLVGCMVADHLVARKIGSGGFGAVYIALQMPLFMKTALKILKVESGHDPSTGAHQARFEKEAQALARLVHPNIVRLFKYGMFNEMPFIVMEYVGEGSDLARELADRKLARRGFSLAEVRRIVAQVAHALEAAHKQNVVHRDIKPANIMLQPVEGEPLFVRVLDFGLAKMVAESPESTVVMGTPIYMAPEQYFGRDIGPWTDLYATALVCFELMTGRRAFSATNSQELFLQKISAKFDFTQEAGNSAPPPAVMQFMRKATAKEPSERYRTVPEFLAGASEMFDALEQAGVRSLHPEASDASTETETITGSAALPVTVPPGMDGATLTSPSLSDPVALGMQNEEPSGQKRRRRILLGMAAALVTLALAGLVFLFWPGGSLDILLSGTTSGDQKEPAMAELPDGRVLAAWRASRPDGATSDIVGRLFDQAGTPLADEFRISSFDGSDLRMPALTAFPDGRVLAIWIGENRDGSGMGVIGQWLSPGLSPYREEFVVNADFGEGDQELADIAVADDDRFAVVWQSYGQDGDDFGIFCQLFAANGDRQGRSFAVNTLTAGRQRFPAVAAGSGQRYMVVWESSQSAVQQEDYTIFGQLLDLDGSRIGEPTVVNSFARGRQRYPDLAAVPSGFVVVWTSEEQDGSGRGVYGQLLDPFGARVGEEFRVNSFTSGDQWVPKVAAFPDGRFVIVWISAGQDGSGFGVFGQSFSADGVKRGSEFQVNDYAGSDQVVRSIIVLGEDRLMVAWDSKDQDGSGWGAFARVVVVDDPVGR